MKKKVVSILLCAAMASTMLAGCGDKGSDNADANNMRTREQITRGMQMQTQTMQATINRRQAARRFP